MSRMVLCRKYKKSMEGLTVPPMPGPKGQDIFDNVSKQAWSEWMELQTQLINEKQLNMMDLGSRAYLAEQLQKFLAGENFDRAEGYVPPTSDSGK